ncbi:MAG: LysR family transcriptional regulator [Candidatus Hydrogenedentes bacterium]|nr:LysR family transcriptional regulator [Candidatus Hydrogenedentota bacterium]
MTLEQLRFFRAVIDGGSFRAAAERVHRTQPAITHQIKALERELGHVLIDRKTAAPTPAGRLLYTRGSALISDADAMRAAMQDFDETQAGELRLGTSDTTALYTLPPIVRRFRRANPGTRLHIVNRPTEVIAQMVQLGDLDIGIVTLPVSSAQLMERVLFEQELVLVVPRRHRMATRTIVRARDLQSEPLLLLEDVTRTGKLLREFFRMSGFTPNIVLDTSSFEVIKRYVAEGIGISFLPRAAVRPRDTTLHVVRVPGLPRVTIGAIWRTGAYQTRAALNLLELFDTPRKTRRR